MEQSEGDMSLKNPVTPPGIDPGTVRLVVQHLNHYATPGPTFYKTLEEINCITDAKVYHISMNKQTQRFLCDIYIIINCSHLKSHHPMKNAV
jgi:hypothetical protein